MGGASRCMLDVNEQRGNGIGNRRALGMQDTTGAIASPFDAKNVGKVLSVASLYLEEKDQIIGRHSVEAPKLKASFVAILT